MSDEVHPPKGFYFNDGTLVHIPPEGYYYNSGGTLIKIPPEGFYYDDLGYLQAIPTDSALKMADGRRQAQQDKAATLRGERPCEQTRCNRRVQRHAARDKDGRGR